MCHYANTLRTVAPATFLVGFGENGLLRGGLAAVDALARAARLLDGDAAHGRFGFFFNAGFAIGVAAPPGKREAFFDGLLEFGVVGGLNRVGFAKLEGPVEEGLLNFVQ